MTPLTAEEIAELHKLYEGGEETALEWRAAALAAHPFLLSEVECIRAALRELDARWLGALDEQNNACQETLDHIYRNAVAPDDQYPFDHKCESCAPLRALLEEAGSNEKEES